MAYSNSIVLNNTASGGTTTLRITWNENSHDNNNNTSNVTMTASLIYNNASWNIANGTALRVYWHDNRENTDVLKATVTVQSFGPGYGPTQADASWTGNILHKSDGTLRGYAWASWHSDDPSTYYEPLDGVIGTDWQNLYSIPQNYTFTATGTNLKFNVALGGTTVATATSSYTNSSVANGTAYLIDNIVADTGYIYSGASSISGTVTSNTTKTLSAMASPQTMYIPVNGESKRVRKLYMSVNGQSKEIKKLYVSVNGQSKLIYQ